MMSRGTLSTKEGTEMETDENGQAAKQATAKQSTKTSGSTESASGAGASGSDAGTGLGGGKSAIVRGVPGWWSVPRRTFLTGAAAMIGLPILDIMGPGLRRAYAAGNPAPRRFVTFGFPAGVNHTSWDPTGAGATYTLSPTLSPLQALKSNFSVLTGINNNPAQGARGHTCGISAFLTCKKVPMTDPAVTESISADQVAANYLGQFTQIPSIELSTHVLHEVPNAETGFSPAYKNVVSWTNSTTSLPFETVPQAAFDRLFAGAAGATATAGTGMGAAATSADAAKRATYRQSVLDSVTADLTAIEAKASAADFAKMDQYLSGLRDLEKQIQTNPATMSAASEGCTPGVRPAAGTPADIRNHVTQMLDLMVLGMQCDATRVLTFFYENTVTSIVHSFLNVNVDYHGSVTHHGTDPTKLANYSTVNQWVVTQLVYFLTKLQAVQEPDGTLLDNSVVFFSSELSDGDAHSHTNLPVVIAGSGGGMLKPGRLIAYQGEKMANLFIALLNAVGVTTTKFGDDGTGPIAGL
jgi:Protein of unknown function (DUF1552)